MTIIEKPQLKFVQRLQDAFKSQAIIPWLLALFLIVTGAGCMNRVQGIALVIIGITYSLLLTFWIFRIAKIHIFKIEESADKLQIYYQLSKHTKEQDLFVNQHLFRTFDKSRYSLKQIHFLVAEKTFIKQYAFGLWTEDEIEYLKKELRKIGFKKTFGENL